MKETLKRYLDLSHEENIVYLTAACVFLPYYISCIVMAVMFFYILFRTDLKCTVFGHPGAFLIPIFSLLTLITAIIYGNWLGILCSLAFLAIMTIGFYIRTVMTEEIYEKALDLCCVFSAFTAVLIIIERLIFLFDEHIFEIYPSLTEYRCFGNFFGNMYFSFYFNPNYLGSILAAVILICAYKIIGKKTDKKRYFIFAFFAAVAMFLTESMFAWIVVFIGLFMLLMLSGKHKLLGILCIAAVCGCFILLIIPEIFPRIAHIGGTTNNRVKIWELTVQAMPDSLWFGKGFFTYFTVATSTPGAYFTTHAHNIFLEPLLSFGIIGSLMLFISVFILFQKIIFCKNYLRKSGITNLILALISGILIHSIVDMTMLWVQTGLLYCVIVGGLGAEEKRFQRIFGHFSINKTKAVTEV